MERLINIALIVYIIALTHYFVNSLTSFILNYFYFMFSV